MQVQSKALVTVATIAVGVGMMMCGGCVQQPELARLLPNEVHGWKAERPDGVYNFDNLYDYIDGGAEVYRSFNVRTVIARRYVKEGSPEIVADLFDMGSSDDAYGAYFHDVREGPEAGVGQDSECLEGYLSFWKGRYFVSILTLDETPESKQAVLDLGRAIAKEIAEKGAEPDIIKLLPEEGRISKHTHYFHNHFCLNAHYFVADDNLLKLDLETEGAVAQYESEPVPTVAAVIRYPSQGKAREAFTSFQQGYMPDADDDSAARTENDRWVVARLKGGLIICVFDAPSKAEGLKMVNDVESKVR